MLGVMGRSPHGERGLKLQKFMIIVGKWSGRSPHGERGLKWFATPYILFPVLSLPTRGAWIEIFPERSYVFPSWSLPTRGAWIEIS